MTKGRSLALLPGDEQRVAATHAPRLSQHQRLAGGRRGPRATSIGDEHQLLEKEKRFCGGGGGAQRSRDGREECSGWLDNFLSEVS
jgi:hypothetical protein